MYQQRLELYSVVIFCFSIKSVNNVDLNVNKLISHTSLCPVYYGWHCINWSRDKMAKILQGTFLEWKYSRIGSIFI